jgi:hypothetical protein
MEHLAFFLGPQVERTAARRIKIKKARQFNNRQAFSTDPMR